MWQQVVLHQLVLEGLLQLWVMIMNQKCWNTVLLMVCWFFTVESSEILPCKAVTKIQVAKLIEQFFLFLCGSAGTSGHSLSARRNELPAGASVPDSSQSSDSDTQPDTHDRGRRFRKRTSCSSRNCEQLQSSEEEYILSTSDETDDSQISSSISSPDSASEIGGAGAHSDQLLTSSTVVTSPSSRGSTIIPSASSQPPGYQEHLGARPRQIQQSASREPVPEIPVLNDGLCSDSESSDSEQLLALQQKRTFFNQILQRIQERREQLSRGQRSIRERGNQRGREIQEALRRPQQEQEEAIPRPQLYTLWFPCCMQYYPCSSCHSRVCDKTRHVTHLTCSHYMYYDQNAEQQVLFCNFSFYLILLLKYPW